MPAIPSGEIAANYHVSHNVFPNIITPKSIDRTMGVERIPEPLRAVPMLAANEEHPEDQAADPLWRLEPEVARA
jgi:hypothetical protein